jgi:hypothetical protein
VVYADDPADTGPWSLRPWPIMIQETSTVFRLSTWDSQVRPDAGVVEVGTTKARARGPRIHRDALSAVR